MWQRSGGRALLVLAASASLAGCIGSGEPPGNVLLITVDALRADHLGCYGYGRDTSPNIDRLAARSTRFEHALVQWPKTSPSVVSIMTSTYGRTSGVMRLCGQRLPDELTVLAEQLRDAGFDTRGIVTNRFLGSDYGFDRGFDQFVEVWQGNGRDDAEHVTDLAMEWVGDLGLEQPFFVWIHYLDPHAPYTPLPGSQDAFTDGHGPDEPELEYSPDHNEIGVVPLHAQIPGPRKTSFYVARYDEEVRGLDGEIGRLLDALAAHSLIENTMVVFTADHGESLGDHNYYFEHGRLPYDACLRVPLLIHVPWLGREAQVVQSPVGLINLAPTILASVGLDAPRQVQGVSMLRLLRRGRQKLPEHVFAEAGYSHEHQRVVRRGRWKLIEVRDEGDRAVMTGCDFELYDIDTDPGETKNLANQYPDVVDELAHRLSQWIGSTPQAEAPAEIPELVSDDASEALRALGYAEEAEALEGGGAG